MDELKKLKENAGIINETYDVDDPAFQAEMQKIVAQVVHLIETHTNDHGDTFILAKNINEVSKIIETHVRKNLGL